MKEKDLSQRDKPNSKELDITTSYIKFYERCSKGEFKGYTLNGLKSEFLSSVSKKDYLPSELDEILKYLYNNIIN